MAPYTRRSLFHLCSTGSALLIAGCQSDGADETAETTRSTTEPTGATTTTSQPLQIDSFSLDVDKEAISLPVRWRTDDQVEHYQLTVSTGFSADQALDVVVTVGGEQLQAWDATQQLDEDLTIDPRQLQPGTNTITAVLH